MVFSKAWDWRPWIVLGLVVRLLLALQLPLWGDEAYSIQVTEQPWISILNNTADPVHPPGYYLLLKAWSAVSSHLVWFRLLGIGGFLLNCFFLSKLFDQHPKKQFFALFLYALSGYFLVFDWQVRMYTLSLSLILASLFFQKKNLPWALFLTHVIGYFFDYAFFWYGFFYTALLVPANIFSKRVSNNTLAVMGSLALYLLHIAFRPELITQGSHGIGWAVLYSHPTFHWPYFLGIHFSNIIFFLTLFLFLGGLWRILSRRPLWDQWETLVVVGGALAYTLTLLTSFVSPLFLFHVRSLQVVGLMALLALTYGLTWLWKKHAKIAFFFCFVYGASFLSVAHLHSLPQGSDPGKLLLHFFEWNTLLDPQRDQAVFIAIGEELNPPPNATYHVESSLFRQRK